MTRIPLQAKMTFAAPLLLMLTSCTFNIFAPLDSPSGDPQLLSTARAALDRGDFVTAAKDYQALSTADADIAASEQAFMLLDQSGAGMMAFASAFGTGGGNAGKAIVAIANGIGSSVGGSAATRLNIFHAFNETKNITDPTLRGLVRFLTSLALIAETLAESAHLAGSFVGADIVTNVAGCAAAGPSGLTGCALASACQPPAQSKLPSGSGTFDLKTATDTTMSDAANAPTLTLIQAAIAEINTALGSTEIAASGALSSAVNSFVSDPSLTTSAITQVQGACYRFALINEGIGT